MKIAIGGDHVGQLLKPEIIEYVESLGHEVKDFGPFTTERTNYPTYSKMVGEAVSKGDHDKGILICGTGVGISIAANKVPGVRAVCCSEPYSAKLSREHNDTNVLAFGSRVVGLELAKMIVKEWLDGEYEGGRHATRVEMIKDMENEYETKEKKVEDGGKLGC